MATDLTGLKVRINLAVEATAKKAYGIGIPEAKIDISKAVSLAFGQTALQADQIWSDRRTIAADGTDAIDLVGDAGMKNPFGGAISFTNIKAIVVINRSDQTTTDPAHTATDAKISVGGAAAAEFLGPFNAAGDAIDVVCGSPFVAINPAANGWAIAEGSDILQIKNEDGVDEALYDIMVIGEAA